MDRKKRDWMKHLLKRYPELHSIEAEISQAFDLIKNSYQEGGKLLIAGNGGSAADAEHLVGELMKEFKLQRGLNDEIRKRLKEIDSVRGERLGKELADALPAINLNNHFAVHSAYLNDIGGTGGFAQQVIGYGLEKDVFLGISCSGNAENVICAAITAKAKKMRVISLTGESGGELASYADISIRVPRKETFEVQELHLPVYHCLALMLEQDFFGGKGK